MLRANNRLFSLTCTCVKNKTVLHSYRIVFFTDLKMTKYNVVVGTSYGRKVVDFYPIGSMKDTLTHQGMVSIHDTKDAEYFVFDSNSKDILSKKTYGSKEENKVDKNTAILIKTNFQRMTEHNQKSTFESISDNMAVSKWLYKSCCHTEWMQRE